MDSITTRINEKCDELLALHEELRVFLVTKSSLLCRQAALGDTREWDAFRSAEPLRWAALGKTSVQTGVMALVRAAEQ